MLLSSKKNRDFRHLRALDYVVRVHAATGRHRLVGELGVVRQTQCTRSTELDRGADLAQ